MEPNSTAIGQHPLRTAPLSHTQAHLHLANQNQRQYFWVISVLYGPFILCTKIAILLLYRRVFVPQRGSRLDVLIKLYMVISALFYFSITVVKIWECNPRARIWAKADNPGSCVNLPILLDTSGAFNTLSDLLILLVPVKAVWNLHMSRVKKIGVCLVFTVGVVYVYFLYSVFTFDLGCNADAVQGAGV